MLGKIPIEIPFYYFLFVGLHDYITPHRLLSYRKNDLIYSLEPFNFDPSYLFIYLKDNKKEKETFLFLSNLRPLNCNEFYRTNLYFRSFIFV